MTEEQAPREIWVHRFTERSAQEFREQVISIAERGGPDLLIPIYIDSYGGCVDSLAKMIETMDHVPNRFACIVSGKAMSCGAILLSHGDLRWCGPYSRIMIHSIQGRSWGDVYDKEQATQETMRMQVQFLGLLAKNCGLTYTQLTAQIKESVSSKEIWLDADEALKFGIVDYVGLPTFIPVVQMSVNHSLTKKRLTDEEKGVKRSKVKQKQKGEGNAKSGKSSSNK
jgi:ATP-dependent Clp endopeptidase proteolytic subunit ClpP